MSHDSFDPTLSATLNPAVPRVRRALASAALLGILMLAGLPACGSTPDAEAPPPPPATTAATARPEPVKLTFSVEPDAAAKIAADIQYLASDELAGRGTGEEGAKKAADFVAKRFAEIGLKPIGDKGENGAPGFLQRFEARVGAAVDPPSLALDTGAKAKTNADAAALITAEGSGSGAASGEAVFVGHGITAAALGWDDYAGGDIAGKIAVVLSGAPNVEGKDKKPDSLRDFGSARYKIRTAREHKAAGVVIVAASDELPAAPTDASSMGVPAIVVKRSAAAKLFPAAKIADKGTWEVKKAGAPKPLPKSNLSITTNVKPVMADAWNVAALLPARDGSKTGSEWIVIGAHYDHLGHGGTSSSRAPGAKAIHHGADDNASGTAMLLYLARRIASLPARPARGIAFIGFGAEEIGAIGSRYWVEHPPVPINSVVAMLNADMVGRLREDKLVVDGAKTAAQWPDIAKAANEGLALNLVFGDEGFGASDHASFTAARVPVSFLFTGAHDDYHKPTDTADKINKDGIVKIATLAGRMALDLTERPDRLAFVDAPADPHRSMRGGFRVSMGTVPDYAFTGKGMKLSGVRPDAPAARAGLQAGDVIVRVGKHEVGNVHDFMYSLQDLEPGREVEVEVDRGGSRVKLKVVPAPSNR
jgi:hypothetical protein